jgi:hypothetical protein
MSKGEQGVSTAERTANKPLDINITEDALKNLRKEFARVGEYEKALNNFALIFDGSAFQKSILNHHGEAAETYNVLRFALMTLNSGQSIKFTPNKENISSRGGKNGIGVKIEMMGMDYENDNSAMREIVSGIFPDRKLIMGHPSGMRDLIVNTLNSGREVNLTPPVKINKNTVR